MLATTLLLSATLAVVAASNLGTGVVSSDGYEKFPTADEPYPTSAYKMHNEYKTWEQAGPICHSEGAHLMVVNSQKEHNIAYTLIMRTPIAHKKTPKILDQFHLGMHCKGHIGHWVTVLGGNLDDSGWVVWAPNQPSPDYPRPVHCGAYLRSMRFNNLACTFHLSRFICEKPIVHTPVSTTLTPPPAPTHVPRPQPAPVPRPKPVPVPSTPDVYETFPSAHAPVESAYKLHRERLSWDIASAICEREGANLVVVNSDDEANIVALLFGRLPPFNPASHRGYDVLHVGITDSHIEGNWLTVHNDPVATCGFNKWRRGEPDNRGGLENCGGITRDKRLVDLDCISLDDSFPFICEKSFNTVPHGREEDIDVRGKRRH